MTDNEIMKALELCSKITVQNCKLCPYNRGRGFDCNERLNKEALDLINRQKAEIETTRTKVIKEFAEKLKSYMSNLEANSPNKAYKTAMEDMLSYYVPKIIDDVVKEMTGDTNG